MAILYGYLTRKNSKIKQDDILYEGSIVKKQLMAIAATAALLFVPAMAKNKVSTHQVHFAKGTRGSTIKGHVKSYDIKLSYL
jgi:hypothetical protein